MHLSPTVAISSLEDAQIVVLLTIQLNLLLLYERVKPVGGSKQLQQQVSELFRNLKGRLSASTLFCLCIFQTKNFAAVVLKLILLYTNGVPRELFPLAYS